jgi:hypothetical protein
MRNACLPGPGDIRCPHHRRDGDPGEQDCARACATSPGATGGRARHASRKGAVVQTQKCERARSSDEYREDVRAYAHRARRSRSGARRALLRAGARSGRRVPKRGLQVQTPGSRDVLVFQTDPDAAGKAGGTRTSGSASSAQRRSRSRSRRSREPAGRSSSAGSSPSGNHSSSSPTRRRRANRGGSST